MRDYRLSNVDTDAVDGLIEFAIAEGCEMDVYEGVLLDNTVIYADKHIKINNGQARDFILIEERATGGWSSTYNLLLTDKQEAVDEFIARHTVEEKEGITVLD